MCNDFVAKEVVDNWIDFMSSFSCQFIDKDYCLRLKKDCIPGRPGCVLKGRFVFAVPIQKRIEENKKVKDAGIRLDQKKNNI